MSRGRGTQLRNIRISPDLWEAAAATAKARGETVSGVIRQALDDYVLRHNAKNGPKNGSGPSVPAPRNEVEKGGQLTLPPKE